MTSPQAVASFWNDLIDTNRRVDSLIERVRKAIQPTLPIGREIPFYGSIEARFENLPTTFAATPATNSDLLLGNNLERPTFTNGGSRVYVREIGFQAYTVSSTTNGRLVNSNELFPFNFRWNFQTSITQRWYSPDRRCLAQSAGRAVAGTHLSFREPLIIEPQETLVFECELLSFGMIATATNPSNHDVAVVAMTLSGYREGV